MVPLLRLLHDNSDDEAQAARAFRKCTYATSAAVDLDIEPLDTVGGANLPPL